VHVVQRGARFLLATSALVLSGATQASDTTKYTYDPVGRLTAVVRSDAGVPAADYGSAIDYDQAGNRLNYRIGTPGQYQPATPPPPDAITQPPPPPATPVNLPPVTEPDYAVAGVCKIVSVDVLANDSESEGDTPLSLVSVTAGALGTAGIVANKVWYHANGATGGDAVTYTVEDSRGAKSTGVLELTVLDKGGCS